VRRVRLATDELALEQEIHLLLNVLPRDPPRAGRRRNGHGTMAAKDVEHGAHSGGQIAAATKGFLPVFERLGEPTRFFEQIFHKLAI